MAKRGWVLVVVTCAAACGDNSTNCQLPPEIAFTAPVGGATILESDDLDPNAAGIQLDVHVDAGVEDGQEVRLTITSPAGTVNVPPQAASDGRVTFRVTFGANGTYRLRADATNACGSSGFATIDVGVGGAPSVPCAIEITPVPIDRPPIPEPVLNAELDPDQVAPKFQATVKVRSTAGNNAELFINLAQFGTRTPVEPDGAATFMVDLDDGLAALRAQCRDQSSNVGTSENSLVFVDIAKPVCAITAPANGHTIIPAEDIDGVAPGTQFNVTATVTGTDADTDGEQAEFSIDGAVQTVAVSGGAVSVVGSLAAPKASVPILLSATDRAGNTCEASITVAYVTDGCSIELVSPTATVTTDGNTGVAGIQSNVVYQLGAACAGKTVTLADCDVGGAALTAVATGGGTATFTDVTLCDQDDCPLSSRTCRASVTNDAGITTSLTSTISVDTQPPLLSVTTFQPPNRCGATVTAVDDIDANPANGVQIRVRVTGFAVDKWVETTPPGNGTRIPLEGSLFANITLALGANVIVGKGTDESGLTGTSAPCTVTLATLAVAITQPLNGAVLGNDDGTVVGQSLQIQVCGTVGSPATATVNVQVDGQAAGQVAATVNPDGTWCANGVTVPAGAHSIDAVAAAGANSGTASIGVTVDLDAPGPPTGLTTTVIRRNAVRVSWTAPDDGSGGAVATCQIRVSAIPIADEAAWNALPNGIVLSGVPPGTPQTALVTPLKTGRPLFFGLRCFDLAGNGSAVVQNASAITLALTSSDPVGPTQFDDWDVRFAQLGASVTGADLNGDGFKDLVVGAPAACRPASTPCTPALGVVYIYMGGAGGLSTTPSFVIRGTDLSGVEFLGYSLTTLDWNRDGVDDIAIGAPLAGGSQGRAFLFLGQSGQGSKWTPGATLIRLDDTSADVTFSPDQVAPFAGNVLLGFQVARLDFDGDGGDDLAIGVPGTPPPGTGIGSGSAIVVHGPPAGTTILNAIRIPQDLGTGAGKAGTTAVAVQFGGGLEFGSVLGALGRVNSDTFDDLGVGPGNQGSSTVRNSAKIIYGRAQTGVPFALLDESTEVRETIIAPDVQNVSRYPKQIASIGDINDDGQRDVMGGDEFLQRVWVVPGGIGPTDPPITRTLPQDAILEFVGLGGGTGAGLANNAAGLGTDIDGDGVEDLVAAGGSSKSVSIWYGGETPFSAAGDDVIFGPGTFTDASGVFWIGDTNADGLADLAFVDSQSKFPSGPGSLVILR